MVLFLFFHLKIICMLKATLMELSIQFITTEFASYGAKGSAHFRRPFSAL
jgi:hypothetical protein